MSLWGNYHVFVSSSSCCWKTSFEMRSTEAVWGNGVMNIWIFRDIHLKRKDAPVWRYELMKNKLRLWCELELNGLLGRRKLVLSASKMSNLSNGSKHVSLILSIIGWNQSTSESFLSKLREISSSKLRKSHKYRIRHTWYSDARGLEKYFKDSTRASILSKHLGCIFLWKTFLLNQSCRMSLA